MRIILAQAVEDSPLMREFTFSDKGQTIVEEADPGSTDIGDAGRRDQNGDVAPDAGYIHTGSEGDQPDHDGKSRPEEGRRNWIESGAFEELIGILVSSNAGSWTKDPSIAVYRLVQEISRMTFEGKEAWEEAALSWIYRFETHKLPDPTLEQVTAALKART
jgi:hypothetical protein